MADIQLRMCYASLHKSALSVDLEATTVRPLPLDFRFAGMTTGSASRGKRRAAPCRRKINALVRTDRKASRVPTSLNQPPSQ
jgi:hypothetical protein